MGQLEIEPSTSDRGRRAFVRVAERVDAQLTAVRRARPAVLVVTTRRWPSVARLALALSQAGFAVRALCPGGQVLNKATFVEATRRLSPLRRMWSLRCELDDEIPDLIVPTDDLAARLLHKLHAQAREEGGASEPLRKLVERSLGAGGRYEELYVRAKMAAAAEAQAILGPRTRPVESPTALATALAEFGLPAVLKTDGSWGGFGVAIVRTHAEAKRAWRRLRTPPSLPRSLKRLVADGEVDPLNDWMRRRRSVVNIQAFVPGRPANAAAALWRGEVLACVCSEAIETLGPTGPASVVQILGHPQMCEAVARMARSLDLSGLCGFDFILDKAGQAHLIEINPRATPTAHLTDADGRSPPQALRAATIGDPVPTAEGRAGERVTLVQTRNAETLIRRMAAHLMARLVDLRMRPTTPTR